MTIDLDRVRRETPGIGKVIHLNNAGASLMPAPVLEAQIAHLRLEAERGGYEAANAAREAADDVYGAAADLIGAASDEIAIVENATVAWDMAFYGLRFGPGDRILTAEAEYASNYIAFLQVARRTGAEVVVVPSGPDGALDVSAMASLIDDRTRLIAITHVPTNGGLVNPAAEIGALARRAGVPFLLDACQSVGHLDIDVARIGCDFLSATGRKYLRGPRGSGFLYVRRAMIERLEPPFLDLHAATWVAPDRFELRPDARRFENWEFNFAARIGLGVAIRYALAQGMPAIEARIRALATRLRGDLSAIPGVEIRDLGTAPCGIVSFTLAGRAPEEVAAALRGQGINISTSTPASTLIDARRRNLPTIMRASVHYYNSEDELDRFCRAIEQLA